MRRIVDLRSDTVTKPTPAMRQAMASAEVGDDVYGEDPTVNRLEAMAAARLGKEAGLFVTSGTMGNLIGVVSHCDRGEEVIVGADSHLFWYEAAGTAVVGGLQLRTLPDADGALHPAAVAEAIRPPDLHFPRTAAVCLENSHNRCGGIVTGPARIAEVARVAHDAGAALHLDGARIFNAAAALDVPAAMLAAEADSVTFCLSKGLAAPIGSVLCGKAGYIARARRLRKMLGGGMRQAGVIAAAGIIALEQMVGRLVEDHRHARQLAEGLAGLPGLSVDLDLVQTNIVFASTHAMPANALSAALAAEGVLCNAMGASRIRLVTHYDVRADDIPLVIDAFARCLGLPRTTPSPSVWR